MLPPPLPGERWGFARIGETADLGRPGTSPALAGLDNAAGPGPSSSVAPHPPLRGHFQPSAGVAVAAEHAWGAWAGESGSRGGHASAPVALGGSSDAWQGGSSRRASKRSSDSQRGSLEEELFAQLMQQQRSLLAAGRGAEGGAAGSSDDAEGSSWGAPAGARGDSLGEGEGGSGADDEAIIGVDESAESPWTLHRPSAPTPKRMMEKSARGGRRAGGPSDAAEAFRQSALEVCPS